MKSLLIGALRFYQVVLSPPFHWLAGPGAGCRFTPTCSQYCLDAVKSHGSMRGAWLGVKRLARCHPWGGHGYDPVPDCFSARSHCSCPQTATSPSDSH